MAVYVRGLLGEVRVNESDSYRRKFPIQVGTAEEQTVTIRLPDGSDFGAASGATCTQISGTQYELDIPKALLDHRGVMYVLCTGATDTQIGHILIGLGSRTGAAQRYDASRPQ